MRQGQVVHRHALKSPLRRWWGKVGEELGGVDAGGVGQEARVAEYGAYRRAAAMDLTGSSVTPLSKPAIRAFPSTASAFCRPVSRG